MAALQKKKLYLHQGCHVIVNSLSVKIHKPKIHTVSNAQIPTQTIAKKKDLYLKIPVVCEVIIGKLATQFPHLSMSVMVHVEDEV